MLEKGIVSLTLEEWDGLDEETKIEWFCYLIEKDQAIKENLTPSERQEVLKFVDENEFGSADNP